MIEFFSSWVKNLGVTIVIVSIFEMILPNNKTKKYIRMILGVFVIFTMISPFIENKDEFNLDKINFENYVSVETINVDQTSMDERIKNLYEEELEKDITKKIEEQGFKVTNCKVKSTISYDEQEESKIDEIKLSIEKENSQKSEESEKIRKTENKIVTEIQKIKEVDTSIKKEETENKDDINAKVTKVDIQNVKKFLIEEYGVSEKCLEIN